MGRKIVITSGKGGVGKTTVVAGLARALASINATVCVVDADIGLNNLDLIMNIENKVVYDLVDCMQSKCRIKQALIKDSVLDCLYTLPAGKNLPTGVIVSFQTIVEKLATIFDFVLVDSPAGLEEGFKRAITSCTEAIVVVTPHISSIRDASKTLTVLSTANNIISSSIVVNRIRGDMVAGGEMMNHVEIADMLNANCTGVVPESDEYNVSSSLNFVSNNQQLINQSFIVMAKNLVNGESSELDYTSKYTGILGFFRRKLKRL